MDFWTVTVVELINSSVVSLRCVSERDAEAQSVCVCVCTRTVSLHDYLLDVAAAAVEVLHDHTVRVAECVCAEISRRRPMRSVQSLPAV